jgi:DNA-binding LacI/PurR family transcriptional regulator
MRPEDTRSETPPTIYDMARLAGVSISTVSLALNAPSRVRPDTSARVHEAIRELGYVPKVEAAIRAQKGTGRIGVVGRFSAVPSANERLQGLLIAASQEGYEVVVYDHGSTTFHPHVLDSLSLARKLDGLILIDVPIAESLAHRLEHDGFPTVLIEYPRSRLSRVAIDNPAGGRLVAQYLVKRGHRQCAFLGLSVEPDPALGFPQLDALRLEGFRSGLAEAKIDLPAQYIQRAPIPPSNRVMEREELRAATHRTAHLLLDLDPPPTAIFANFDLLASVVLTVARERGLRVPEDLAVVGFDDCDFAAFLGLTTVRQHLSESGRAAFQLLRDSIGTGHSSVVKTVTLPLHLIARTSA